jgi:hypothetical protein
MKQSKIKTITVKENTFNGKTSKSYTCVLEDGSTGYLDGKVAGGFKEGDDVEYLLEVKQNKQGKDYNLLTLTKTQASAEQVKKALDSVPITPAYVPHAKFERMLSLKFEAMLKATDKVVDLVIAGKIGWKDFKEGHKELSTYLYAEIDELYREG